MVLFLIRAFLPMLLTVRTNPVLLMPGELHPWVETTLLLELALLLSESLLLGV
jgi:hypothetical protein